MFFEARICPWRVDHKPAVWHAWWTRAALIEPQRASIAELLESKGIYNNVVRVHLRQAAMCPTASFPYRSLAAVWPTKKRSVTIHGHGRCSGTALWNLFIRFVGSPIFIRLSKAVSVSCPRISFYPRQTRTTHSKWQVLKGVDFVGVFWGKLLFLINLQDCGSSGRGFKSHRSPS